MVKRSKKSKSKRVPLKKKYKVIRKVKEHHKKKAKEAKKLGFQRKKVEKDPGIPNDWPFKEQELKALEARRARVIDEIEQKKAARKERAQKRKLGKLEEDHDSKLDELIEEKSTDDSTGFSKNRDSSDRAFYKELVKVIEASDVILEVLDARDPLGTRCIDMEKMVRKSGPNKHLVLLLNKIDLIPREAVEKWLTYLREELPAVAFKCSTQEQKSNLGWKSSSKKSKPSNLLQTSDCLGAETLLKLLKNYSRSHEIKKSITVGIIGLPNVGKSSLINSLKRCRVVNVGSTPGLTRSLQEVQLDNNVKLLDCPGVVMLKSTENDASIALRNCKRIEKLEDPIGPVKEILKLCPARLLVSIYKLPSFDTVDDFLQKVATVRGKLKKGGIVDIGAAARIVLHDWNEGKIPYYTMPPARSQEEPSEAKIVSELGKALNIDEVYNGESSFIGSLKSVNVFHPVEVPPSCPLNFDENMVEDDAVQRPSSEADGSPKDMVDEDDDQSMAVEEDEPGKAKEKTTKTSRQNEKLYAIDGMLNTKKKKAEKKMRKKAKSASKDAMEDDDDYDFKVDYVKKGSAMDVTDGTGGNDDCQITGKVPMSGIGFGISRTDGSEAKFESACVSEEGSPLEHVRRHTTQKSLVSEGTAGSVRTPASDQSISGNISMDASLEQVNHMRTKESTDSPTVSYPSPAKLSVSLPSTSSLSASPLSSQYHLPPASSTPSKWPRYSPRHQLLRQVSDGRIPGNKSPSYHSISEDRVTLPSWSNESARGSRGGSSDSWSMHAFSELMATSNRERWSFDSESFGFNREKITRSSSRISASPSVDLQTCGICSKLLTEKSSWSGQKFIANNELSVVAVLTCGHAYHAECLEHMTPDINKYDPACPVCTFGEKQIHKLSEKALKAEMDLKARNRRSRNRVLDLDSDSVVFDRLKGSGHQGKGPKMASSSSMRSSSGKPFLRRLSFGSKSARTLSENHSTRKKGFFWAKSIKN